MYIDIRAIARNKWTHIGVLAVVFIILALVASGCSSSSTHHSIASKLSCGESYRHWYKNGGKGLVLSIERQAGPLAQALKAGNTNQLKGVAGELNADSTLLETHLPPNCIPGADPALEAMLSDLNKAAVKGQENKLPQAQAALKKASEKAGQWGKDVSAFVK